MQPIPDHLRPGLDVIFVGYNPSIRSSKVGHHYAHPSNRFWKVLYLAGFTPRLYRSDEGDALLDLGYGFTNIVARPTRTAAEITAEEYAEGRRILQEKLAVYKPKAACFVGKGVYEKYSENRQIQWGEQPEPIVPGMIEFVAPSTSGLVRMTVSEIAVIFGALRQRIGR